MARHVISDASPLAGAWLRPERGQALARHSAGEAPVERLFFRPVQPVGQHEQAKNNKHDDQDVANFHGASLSKKG